MTWAYVSARFGRKNSDLGGGAERRYLLPGLGEGDRILWVSRVPDLPRQCQRGAALHYRRLRGVRRHH